MLLKLKCGCSDQDDFDVSDPEAPKFGGNYLLGPGIYDFYAIRYGYTVLGSEVRGTRHDALALLANGQAASELVLRSVPRNPSFATDEQLYDDYDPRVNTFVSVQGAKRMGKPQMAYVALQRVRLLEQVRAGAMEPDTYVSRFFLLLRLAWTDLQAATKWVGGGTVDARREVLTPAGIAGMNQAVNVVV